MEKSFFDRAKEKFTELTQKNKIKVKAVKERFDSLSKPSGYILFEGKSIQGLIKVLEDILTDKYHMEVVVHRLEDGNVLLFARDKKGELKQIIGLDKAIVVHIKDYKNGQIEVELKESKWMDKAFAFMLSSFTLWPLVVAPGIGIYLQVSLLEDIQEAMDNYFEIE